VDGHTKIEHTVPVGKVYEDVLQLWSQTPVGYTPTLGVAFGGLDGEHYWYAKTEVWREQPLARLVPRALLDAASRRRTLAPEEEWNHIRQAEVAKALAAAGVDVSLGAHGQREGLAAHWELWSLVQGGMSPLEAWRAGSLAGARSLGMERDLGTIEAGKLADFVVIDGNPLEDIRQSTALRWVVANGRVYDSRRLEEIWPNRRFLGEFWFRETDASPGWEP
jgi:imidazolonepropionase-like amidohydrolase